jgi:hypothetical protein
MKFYSITRSAHKLDIYVFYSDDKDKITKYDLTVRSNATYDWGRGTFALITSTLLRNFGLDNNLREQLVHALQSRYGIKREEDTTGMFIKRELRLSLSQVTAKLYHMRLESQNELKFDKSK